MIDPKVAVLVAGPFRYAHLVLKNLERFLHPFDFDVFFMIWKTDLGNKRRVDECWEVDEVLAHARTKALILAEPYPEEFYAPTIGTETGSNSPINATMGMLYSMSALCSYLAQLPNLESYSHCLRTRTDCAIVSPRFSEKLSLDSNTVVVSKNYGIPNGWLSDHITFAPREHFFKLWHHPNIDSIYSAYRHGHRNPERTLAHLARTRLRGVEISEALIRYDDYTIVYSPVPDLEPEWIKKAVAEHGTQGLFEHPEEYRDETEVTERSRLGKLNAEKITPSVKRTALTLAYRVRRRCAMLLARDPAATDKN